MRILIRRGWKMHVLVRVMPIRSRVCKYRIFTLVPFLQAALVRQTNSRSNTLGGGGATSSFKLRERVGARCMIFCRVVWKWVGILEGSFENW